MDNVQGEIVLLTGKLSQRGRAAWNDSVALSRGPDESIKSDKEAVALLRVTCLMRSSLMGTRTSFFSFPPRRVARRVPTGKLEVQVADGLPTCRFSVVVTVRSSGKGNAVLESLDENLRSRVLFEVVEDVAADGAFDQVSSGRG